MHYETTTNQASPSETYGFDDILLGVGAGAVQRAQDRLQVLGAVVFSVQHQDTQQLGRFDPRAHQPVANVPAHRWHQTRQVPHHQLPTAQARALH